MRLGLAKVSALLAGAVLFLLAISAGAGGRRAVVLEIDGAIGPAVADYVVRGLQGLDPGETGLAVLRIDTPGGLGSSMREIIRAMLASPVPVAVYVAPSGARAASAGTYIAYAAAIAAMAPGTNLGAATPIQIGGLSPLSGKPKEGDGEHKSAPDDAESRKILNDAVAFIRSLADLHGRNAEWAADAVRNAVSLPATEALQQHVIDLIADDVPDLLRKIDGRTALVAGKSMQLRTAGLEVVTLAPDWRVQLLSVVTDPNIAYLLMLLGIYGLIFELANPGVILPGLIGGISLLLALFAFNLLPVDYAGAGLVVLGVALMVAEAFIGSFGAIGLAGIAAFAIGSIIMFRGTGPTFGLSLSVVIAATIVTGAFFLLGLALLLRSRRRRVVTGSEAMIGAEGEALEWQGATGRIRVHGEIWYARAAQPLQPGARIRVTGRTDLVLTVEPI